MKEWFQKLLADKDGNPNEHIVAALWGSFVLALVILWMVYAGKPVTLTDYGMAHGAIWAAAGAGQKLSGGS
jgi:glucose uptake protein GlcU